jgi:hypothetical protein
MVLLQWPQGRESWWEGCHIRGLWLQRKQANAVRLLSHICQLEYSKDINWTKLQWYESLKSVSYPRVNTTEDQERKWANRAWAHWLQNG